MCSSGPACVLSVPQRRGATLEAHPSRPAPMGNHGQCSLVAGALPAITRTHAVDEGEPPPTAAVRPPASSRSQRMSGWKTSKFFSRTMSSGEILRGLKKLSLTATASDPTPAEADAARPRKSRSGQLKKRSSCGDDDRARSPRSPGGFRPLSKAMSLSEPGTTGKATGLGIVCKKEDLKALLCSATSKKFPLASPKKRNRLRQTKSASFEPPAADEGGTARKELVRRAGSEENRAHNEPRAVSPLEAPQVPPAASSSVVSDLNALNAVESASTSAEAEPPPTAVKGTAVKWDECEVVDAVLIGDAIESYLKGSMSVDKKVSFRRQQHPDRKTKSDG